MLTRRVGLALFPVLWLFCANPAVGDDCTRPNFISDVLVGGEPRTGTVAGSFPGTECHWYRIANVAADRSYSLYVDAGASSTTAIETDAAFFYGSPFGDRFLPAAGGPFLKVFSWIVSPGRAGAIFIRLGRAPAPLTSDYTYRLRVVETTMWCPWWFIGGDYNAFTLVRGLEGAGNTIFIWRDLAGQEVGRTDTGIPRRSGFFVNARDWVSPGTTMGTVEIIHEGPLDAITAVTTTLSATTGLSFDAAFTRRPTY